MSGPATDISWGVLRQVVQDWAGDAAELRESRRLNGGSVNATFVLTLADQRQAVLKITPHRVDRRYEDEAYQLSLIAAAGLPTPEIYGVHIGSLDRPYSYILMEWIDGVDLNDARGRCTPDQFDQLQRHLAELLARLHETTGPGFGRVSATDPDLCDNWGQCFRRLYDSAWREVEQSGVLPVRQRKVVARVHDRLERLLPCDGPARLLHGDAWASNLLARPDEAGNWRVVAVLDPSSKFGCREAELAYLDQFHTATPAFFKAYQSFHKLPPDYHQLRKPIYQLYNLVHHSQLFGPAYAKALCDQATRVGALV